MVRYVLRRLALAPIVLLGMTFVVFVSSQLIPTDPVVAYFGPRYRGGTEATEAAIAQLREQWGWDRPILERYAIYLTNLSQGDFGTSTTSRRPVLDDLVQYTPATLELVLASMLIALIVAPALALLVATRRHGRAEGLFKIIAVVVVSAPVFWVALIALDVFYRQLGWAAGAGRLDLFILEPPRITGMLLVDSLIAGRLDAFANAVHHLALPACLLGVIMGVYFARVIHAEMIDAMEKDYVRTARGKGVRERWVLTRHAFRNALLPAITLSGLAFGALLTSTIVVENAFGWAGLGSYAYRAAVKVDLQGIAGVTLILGTIYVIINLVVDLLYAVVDPRVRLR